MSETKVNRVDEMVEILQRWQGLERQKTPFHVVPLAPDAEITVKPDIALRAIEVAHTGPSQARSRPMCVRNAHR